MVDCILHQRLQRHFWDQTAIQRGIGQNIIGQDVAVTYLLDLEVTAHMEKLLMQGQDVFAVGQEGAEIIGETRNHLHSLFVFFGFNQPDDRVKRVIEKVGINLCLNQLEFHTVQPDLLLTVQCHLLVQTVYHLLQPRAEGLQAAVFGPHGCAGRKISFPDLNHALIQEVNWF